MKVTGDGGPQSVQVPPRPPPSCFAGLVFKGVVVVQELSAEDAVCVRFEVNTI